MRCPHCIQDIRVLSRSMSPFGRDRSCPRCQGKVRITFNPKVLVIGFFLTLIGELPLALFIERQGFYHVPMSGIMAAVAILPAMRLKAG